MGVPRQLMCGAGAPAREAFRSETIAPCFCIPTVRPLLMSA